MRRKIVSVETLERIATNAMLGGYGRVKYWRENFMTADGGVSLRLDPHGGLNRRYVVLECSMDCFDPFEYEMHGRYSATHGKRVKPIIVLVRSRCRKCEACKKRRQMFWQARALTEYALSYRSIFGTLTFTPENDVMIDALARIEQSECGVDFDALNENERFRVRAEVGGREVTKWLKRLRSGDLRHDKPQFRYLIVAEAHLSASTSAEKRGRPHFHVLLHESDPGHQLVNSDEWSDRCDKYGNRYVADQSFLKAQWHAGFSRFSHCGSPQAASYLCKYLTKDELAVRIRASFKYGREAQATPTEAVRGKEN